MGFHFLFFVLALITQDYFDVDALLLVNSITSPIDIFISSLLTIFLLQERQKPFLLKQKQLLKDLPLCHSPLRIMGGWR